MGYVENPPLREVYDDYLMHYGVVTIKVVIQEDIAGVLEKTHISMLVISYQELMN